MPTKSASLRRGEVAETRAGRAPQARSVATQRRLLDATVGCLIERGYAGTTTPEVCRRADVSQGALFKHFPTKAVLLGCAAQHLFDQLIEDFRRSFAGVSDADDRIGAVVQVLWGIFTQPRLHAAFELFTAARTDPVLRDQLGPVMQRHRGILQSEARRHFPEAAARGRDFEVLVVTVLDALQGAALGALVNGGSADAERVLPLLERVARRELADV